MRYNKKRPEVKIPTHILRILGFEPGDMADFTYCGDGVLVTRTAAAEVKHMDSLPLDITITPKGYAAIREWEQQHSVTRRGNA